MKMTEKKEQRKLTILFSPIEAHGHINASTAIGQELVSRGHRVVFTLNQAWKGKLIKYGFEEAIIGSQEEENSVDTNNFFIDYIKKNSALLRLKSPLEKSIQFSLPGFTQLADKMMANEEELKSVIKQLKPDVIIIDNYIYSPSLSTFNIPWVRIVSCNPLFILDHPKTPPGTSGLPTGDELERDKVEFRLAKRKAWRPLWEKLNNWVKAETKSKESLPENVFHQDSPWANLYMMPQEVDYIDLRPLPDKWFAFDGLVREESNDSFVLPKCLTKNETQSSEGTAGKLVYVSMGTIGCADIELMQRLVHILSHSKHRFIVSKGPLGDRYELASNMWGENSLPQTQVIPLVDLVITHGGNNTFNECFHFGKPMIVMPLFGDQFDNAIRVQEKRFGVRLDPYYCTQEELLATIDKLVNDKELKLSLTMISKRIASSRSKEKVADLIESLIELK